MSNVKMTSWQSFENHVRLLASSKWSAPALPERINDVKCDCVLKPKPDHWILIEITEEQSLRKCRDDLSKFSTVKPYLLSKGIYSECFMVIEDLPLESTLRGSGTRLNVEVMNQNDFCNFFLNYQSYVFNRKKKNFGSAVEPISGENDKSKYINVKYNNPDNNSFLTITEIVEKLYTNKKIVLTGDYGTGKSRCISELFNILSEKFKVNFIYPLAINLREYWGLQTKEEILIRHFRNLGLVDQTSTILKIIDEEAIILLLDGFDEISSQSWSDDPVKLIEIKKKALLGVKDLISHAKGGVLITGRDYYFNSNSELVSALGLPIHDTIYLECLSEFSDAEVNQYLAEKKLKNIIPQWLPKKPLMVQLFSLLNQKECERLLQAKSEIQLCRLFIDQICERETRINDLLEKNTIKEILIRLAKLTRSKVDNFGPISIEEINTAFTDVTGSRPVDQSAVMLQRLPGLARFEAESRDRKFIDIFMLDPLRAEDVLHMLMLEDESVMMDPWRNYLCDKGIAIVATEINAYSQFMFRLLKKTKENFVNRILPVDLFNALVAANDDIDMHDVTLNSVTIDSLCFDDVTISNFHIENSIINTLEISKTIPNNVSIENCIIMNLNGVADQKELPSWISKNCTIDKFSKMNTLARIRSSNLSEPEQLLIATLKRIFCQPGKGRKEQSLLKGFGQVTNVHVTEKIIKLLLKEKIISIVPGDDGKVYTPIRKHTQRIQSIINRLSMSNDPLYLEVKSWTKKKM